MNGSSSVVANVRPGQADIGKHVVVELGQRGSGPAVLPGPDEPVDRGHDVSEKPGLRRSALAGDERCSFTHGKSPSFAGMPGVSLSFGSGWVRPSCLVRVRNIAISYCSIKRIDLIYSVKDVERLPEVKMTVVPMNSQVQVHGNH